MAQKNSEIGGRVEVASRYSLVSEAEAVPFGTARQTNSTAFRNVSSETSQ